MHGAAATSIAGAHIAARKTPVDRKCRIRAATMLGSTPSGHDADTPDGKAHHPGPKQQQHRAKYKPRHAYRVKPRYRFAAASLAANIVRAHDRGPARDLGTQKAAKFLPTRSQRLDTELVQGLAG